MVMCSRLSPRSFHHQHRALGELHDPTSDHSLVQCRVACRPDDEQIDLELGCELNDIAHRMAGEQVGVQLYLAVLGHLKPSQLDPTRMLPVVVCRCAGFVNWSPGFVNWCEDE